ncbi:MAG: phytanoyl-CoA dioxygenase [Bacteroidota bacterium]|nr:phytanoyl-CoA dioxygenase [Bacteroidota bacterium]
MTVKFYKKFTLGGEITEEQKRFFDEFGFIHFEKFIDEQAVSELIHSTEAVQANWVSNNINQVNGVPIKFGFDEDGKKIVQRFSFTNLFSPEIKNLLGDERLQVIKGLLPGARIGELEKDGVVVNHYVNVPNSNYKQLGWHTDSARDIFYGKKIHPMLNAGIYLDDSSEENGGLRILPGTHKQNIFSMLFRKAYFLSNNDDKDEILVRAKKGDLVIHDGRMWHRVGQSPHFGARSRRRVIYVPFLVDRYQPKDANSKTPFYLKFQKLIG